MLSAVERAYERLCIKEQRTRDCGCTEGVAVISIVG